ncbi:hypothetical protein Hbl1158_14960 (plasmid) [Halobaculum sp. CBA1158]|uniref:hypothetical protein n=1 Tax=Halobaculum sp. CBA1158 TaxID=2904243 RepID=UPI001F254006|nr:hypothetical protein [Halobaculum sp. CBA1158]UIP01437.1 hypothetical protein Hbl1158_14960 [Halobaculum sp. CBA1158]
MTDYELDATDTAEATDSTDAADATDPTDAAGSGAARDPDAARDAEAPAGGAGPDGSPSERLGVPVPDEHVGAFLAEAFEDPERDAAWADVVDSFVPESARDEWRDLSMVDRLREVLAAADGYDARVVELLDGIPLDREEATAEMERTFHEAMRLRRNADTFRSGIADAHAEGRVADEALVDAVEGYGFDTDTIAEREDLVEAVAERYGFGFRPYGGTLMDTDDPADRETGEVW